MVNNPNPGGIMSDVKIPEARKRRWKMADIAESKRQLVDETTAGWTAEQLRTKLAEVLTQVEPIRYTLSHIADNPGGPHSGMAISSQLFPETFGEDSKLSGPWTSAWDKELKKSVPVAFTWDGEPPERAHWQSAEFAGGVTPGPSFNILEVWQYATASSIFCGSFGTDDVLALNEACHLSSKGNKE